VKIPNSTIASKSIFPVQPDYGVDNRKTHHRIWARKKASGPSGQHTKAGKTRLADILTSRAFSGRREAFPSAMYVQAERKKCDGQKKASTDMEEQLRP
jgi:hypothetical protein